jgi:hypothetical protein
VFFVVLLSCTTVSTGPSGLSTGRIELFTPIVWVFSLPIWVLAATLVPPDRNDRGFSWLQLLKRSVAVSSADSVGIFTIDVYPKEASPCTNYDRNKPSLCVSWVR